MSSDVIEPLAPVAASESGAYGRAAGSGSDSFVSSGTAPPPTGWLGVRARSPCPGHQAACPMSAVNAGTKKLARCLLAGVDCALISPCQLAQGVHQLWRVHDREVRVQHSQIEGEHLRMVRARLERASVLV